MDVSHQTCCCGAGAPEAFKKLDLKAREEAVDALFVFALTFTVGCKREYHRELHGCQPGAMNRGRGRCGLLYR